MKPSLEQGNAFLAGDVLPGVRFRHNDYVRVISGPYSGNAGSLISVEELGADPLFLVELESQQDALVPQSALVLVETECN
jgi:hypothetical protein